MAKKHKHEEHVNHERWLVSFADMMTLLFALFVVLYSLGSIQLEKLKQLKNSVQFAFHIAGDGKTQDTGIFEKQTGGGDVMAAVPLVTAQDGPMREFLKDVLADYNDVAGSSPRYVQTDDSVALTAPLSDFFEPDQRYPVRTQVKGWLDRTLAGALTFASDITVAIETPNVTIGKDTAGRVVTSVDLCEERLKTLRRAIRANPEILEHMVETRFRVMKELPSTAGKSWEETAIVRITFSNPR